MAVIAVGISNCDCANKDESFSIALAFYCREAENSTDQYLCMTSRQAHLGWVGVGLSLLNIAFRASEVVNVDKWAKNQQLKETTISLAGLYFSVNSNSPRSRLSRLTRIKRL